MEVSVALGLLVSELAEEPWKGKLITFSEDPELQSVEGNDLRTKTEFIRRMAWGANTDFQRVFDLILRVAVQGNLKPEQMIKRVYVFSDMEFDQASTTTSNEWETDYEMISRKFKEKGFEAPEMVFWNLRDSRATPVTGNKKGVALVSGFSKNLIKVFLEHDGEIDPMMILEAVLSGTEYSKLVVIENDTRSTQIVNWAKQERPKSNLNPQERPKSNLSPYEVKAMTIENPKVKANIIENSVTKNNLNHITSNNKFMALEYLGSDSDE